MPTQVTTVKSAHHQPTDESKIRRRLLVDGFEPIPTCGKRPLMDGWQKDAITAERLTAWEKEHPDHLNTGLRTGRTVAVDVDVRNNDLLGSINFLLPDVLGESDFIRVGMKGYAALYSNSEAMEKVTVEGRYTGYDKDRSRKERVEILGMGQQLVAHGIHPETKEPYRWPKRNILNARLSDLPNVTPVQLKAAARAIHQAFVDSGIFEVVLPLSFDKSKESEKSGEPVTYTMLREMLTVISPDIPREQWIALLGGIKSAVVLDDETGEGISDDEIEELAMEWSRGDLCGIPYAHPDFDEDRIRRDYEGLQNDRKGGSGLGTVIKAAREAGYIGPNEPSLLDRHDWQFPDGPEAPATNDDKEPEKPRRRFAVLSEAMQDETSDIEYLMDRIIPVESVGMIYAPERSFKTFATMDMVLCGAAGIPWAKGDGNSGFAPIRSLNVIFIAGEGARGIAKKRRPAWREHHGIEGKLPFYTIGEMPRFTSAEDVKAIIASIGDSPCPKPDIIVIDTVAVAMTGADENSAMDTGVLIANCRKLIKEFGCSVILIHHTGKDEKKGSRGSTNLPYGCDFRYRVKEAAGSTPDRRLITIKQEKMKDEELLPLMMFEGRKAAESLVFERVSSVKTPGGVFTDTVEIVAEALEAIPKGKEVTAYAVARHAVNGNLTQEKEDTLKRRIQRDLNKEETRRPYNHLIKEKDDTFVFVGQQEQDEESGEMDAPDI